MNIEDYNLRIYPDPILIKTAEPLAETDFAHDELSQIITHMIDVMKKHNGIGLAAPQIGLSKHLFIAKNPSTEDIVTFINPRLHFDPLSALVADIEGCLSLPDIIGRVTRRERLESVEYFDISFQPKRIENVTGIFARCIQHEYDHLLGTLIISRFSPGEIRRQRQSLEALKLGTKRHGEDHCCQSS